MMRASGVPDPDATGLDRGNNPRGAIVQMIKDFGWKSIGGSPVTLSNPYGTVSTGVFSGSAYDSMVKAGKVPSGALVFQTRHNSWKGTSPGSSGYDMAIAQKKGTSLWNGNEMGQWVYPGRTKKVIVLTPDGKSGDGSKPTSDNEEGEFETSPPPTASNPLQGALQTGLSIAKKGLSMIPGMPSGAGDISFLPLPLKQGLKAATGSSGPNSTPPVVFSAHDSFSVATHVASAIYGIGS